MPLRTFLLRATLALLISLALNAAIYWLAVHNGWWDPAFTSPRYSRPLNWFPVLVNTLQAAVVGSLMFRMLTYYVTNGYLYFYFLGAVVFILMFFAPLRVEGLPVNMITSLEILHVTTAAPMLLILPWGLTREE